MNLLSRVRLPATPWTATYQVPPSKGFSRQEYWSGVPLRQGLRAKGAGGAGGPLACAGAAAAWVDLDVIILSEVSQPEKDKYHVTYV